MIMKKRGLLLIAKRRSGLLYAKAPMGDESNGALHYLECF